MVEDREKTGRKRAIIDLAEELATGYDLFDDNDSEQPDKRTKISQDTTSTVELLATTG